MCARMMQIRKTSVLSKVPCNIASYEYTTSKHAKSAKYMFYFYHNIMTSDPECFAKVGKGGVSECMLVLYLMTPRSWLCRRFVFETSGQNCASSNCTLFNCAD